MPSLMSYSDERNIYMAHHIIFHIPPQRSALVREVVVNGYDNSPEHQQRLGWMRRARDDRDGTPSDKFYFIRDGRYGPPESRILKEFNVFRYSAEFTAPAAA